MGASYLIFFKSRGTLIQTRRIFEEGCHGFANFVVHTGNSPSIRHPAEQGGESHMKESGMLIISIRGVPYNV